VDDIFAGNLAITRFAFDRVRRFFVFIYVGVLFFSSFFTYAEGVGKAFEAYAILDENRLERSHAERLAGLFEMALKIESPIMIAAAIGSLIAPYSKRVIVSQCSPRSGRSGFFSPTRLFRIKRLGSRFRFCCRCALSPVTPSTSFSLRATFGQKILGGILSLVAVAILGYQTYDLNFKALRRRFDAVCLRAHQARISRFNRQIEYYAEKSGKGQDATIEIVSPDYWSMPWYLNDYKHANFHGRFVDANTAEMIVAKKGEQDAEANCRVMRRITNTSARIRCVRASI
jgi:hypothetical protein